MTARITRVSLEPRRGPSVQEVELSAEELADVRAEQAQAAFLRFKGLVEKFEADAAAGRVLKTHLAGKDGPVIRYRQWDELASAYRFFRSLFVPFRKKPKKVLRHDPSLERWVKRVDEFLDMFWGVREADGKRRFGGVAPEIAATFQLYQRLQSRWHKLTPEYRRKHKRYMKMYMRRKRAGLLKTKKTGPKEATRGPIVVPIKIAG